MVTYTNKWNNSDLVGATVGVVGSGGVFPTGWSLPTTGGGVTITNEVVSLTTTNLQYIMRAKITVVNASGGDAFPNTFMGQTGTVAGSTLHQIALWTRYVSLTGTTYFAWLACLQNNGTNTTNLYSLTNTFTRGTNSFTTNAAATAVTPYIGLGVPAGQSCTLDYEVSQGMFEQGATLTSYIPTTSATPVSRDVVSFRGPNKTYLEM